MNAIGRRSAAQRLGLVIAAALLIAVPATTAAQEATPTPLPPYAVEAERIVENMTVRQKVGQVLMISYPGDDAAAARDVIELVDTYHIGGVQLKASLKNFTNTEETPALQIARTARMLQTAAYSRTLTLPEPTQTVTDVEENFAATVVRAPQVDAPVVVPLFIGLAHDNDIERSVDVPEIDFDAAPPPSPMALGATWKPTHATEVGRVFGNQLAHTGINLFFGPGLDVLEQPRPGTPGDPGVHVFGGDPFWVGRFGAAYYAGLRAGSDNRIALVARNFPGLGASDRNVLDEIPTVQKSLEQLRQNELQPYFAVTQRTVATATVVDGLQVTHLRFRGFQGNIRSSTRPVSIDPQAHQALFALPELAAWRDGGGVIFSEQLGTRSIRRFYDANETTFNARRIAQEAFMAGNDVLVLGSFGLGATWQEQLTAIKEVAGFFANKYVDDPAFAARIDQSARRIVALKLRLYGGRFTAKNVLNAPLSDALSADAAARAASAVARDSITLLSPDLRDLPSAIPAPPGRNDTIVFLTDDRPIRECPRCAPYPAIDKLAMRDIAVSLYGPSVTGQVDPRRTFAFSLQELRNTELGGTNEATATQRIRSAIDAANWIVVGLLDMDPRQESSQAFRRFLADQADDFKDKRVIVFAFGAPYHLDATEVSKITAYFGAYGRSQATLTTAVRVLFGEYTPPGASPVSVDATRYVLSRQIAPDPTRLIPLTSSAIASSTAGSIDPLVLKIGDKLDLTAGPIFDSNGNPVPDGTEVFFVLNYPNEGVEQPRIPATTRDGAARITLPIERQGTLNITVESDQAKRSDTIRVNAAVESVLVERIQPTPEPTQPPMPTVTDIPEPTPAPPPAQAAAPAVRRVSPAGFATTIAVLLAAAAATIVAVAGMKRSAAASQVRIGAIVWICGWAGYIAYALEAPGTRQMAIAYGWLGGPLAAGACALITFGIAVLAARNAADIADAAKRRQDS